MSASTRTSESNNSLQPLEVSLSPEARFEEYLQSRGLRQTAQRKFLIGQVFSDHDHFDAEELMEQLPRRGEENYVSSATVYRTLREFVDAGLLKSFQLEGRTVYEHDYGYPQHDHLYCTRCRKLIEFQSDELVNLRNEVAAKEGFRVTSHRMIIQGVCRQCSKSRRKETQAGSGLARSHLRADLLEDGGQDEFIGVKVSGFGLKLN